MKTQQIIDGVTHCTKSKRPRGLDTEVRHKLEGHLVCEQGSIYMYNLLVYFTAPVNWIIVL